MRDEESTRRDEGAGGGFGRYRPLLDDWDAFCTALARPLPTCIWTNVLRTTPDAVAARLAAAGVGAAALPWHPGAFRLPDAADAGRRLGYVAGGYHIQEEVSMLPVALLAPQPGERVLDLCAAPGNKTAQIAVAMGDVGTVVANDINAGRSRAIRGTLDRLGLRSVCITTADAARYPAAAGLFDRVLADVPCSCEGTTRKQADPTFDDTPRRGRDLPRLQAAILRRALRLCRPGGRVVYATCTYAPEENEAVVDAVLGHPIGRGVRLLPAALPGFASAPGLTAWEGASYHPDLRNALRAWPHHNDTGGFFVAVLQKPGTTPPALPPAALPPVPGARRVRDGLRAWYGLGADAFSGEPVRAVRRYVSLVPQGFAPPAAPTPVSFGLPFYRDDARYPKLTSAAALLAGAGATRNVIDVDAADAAVFIARGAFGVVAGRAAGCANRGYVIVRHAGLPLGIGLFARTSTGGRVESHFPKGWSIELAR